MLLAAEPTVHLGVTWRATQYPLLYEGIPWHQAVGGVAELRFERGLTLSSGVRLVFPAPSEPSWAVEGHLGVGGVTRIGRWRPGAGIELGASSRHTSEVLETERPPGSYFADLGAPEPLWIDFVATPARFAWKDWELSVAGLGVGVSLPHFGLSGRLHVDALIVTRSF
jgi:hypothetical protein